MTDNMMNLWALVEKTPDADRLMELEVGAATGAAYGEKSPLRTALDLPGKKWRDFLISLDATGGPDGQARETDIYGGVQAGSGAADGKQRPNDWSVGRLL